MRSWTSFKDAVFWAAGQIYALFQIPPEEEPFNPLLDSILIVLLGLAVWPAMAWVIRARKASAPTVGGAGALRFGHPQPAVGGVPQGASSRAPSAPQHRAMANRPPARGTLLQQMATLAGTRPVVPALGFNKHL